MQYLYFLAHLMVSCPYASLMPHTMISRSWTINELISSFQCYNCLQDIFNRWAPCLRQASQINCHPNLTSRCRQLWFILLNYVKFLKMKPEFDDDDFEFQGEHLVEHSTYIPSDADHRKMTDFIPKYLQQTTIIRRGKSFIF